MLTRVRNLDPDQAQVSSFEDDVQVAVARNKKGESAPLSRAETHEVLVKAKEKAQHFIAAVEGDIEATET